MVVGTDPAPHLWCVRLSQAAATAETIDPSGWPKAEQCGPLAIKPRTRWRDDAARRRPNYLLAAGAPVSLISVARNETPDRALPLDSIDHGTASNWTADTS